MSENSSSLATALGIMVADEQNSLTVSTIFHTQKVRRSSSVLLSPHCHKD
ncbi:hypothetical protein [Methanolobus sp.]|nr:hypothetical protein [Methanolobus sp.]